MSQFKLPCQNCKGKGVIEHYKHIENGICFTCSGSGLQDATEEEYNDHLHQLELDKQRKKEGKYILFNQGNIEYYNSKKEIHNKYGTFYTGSFDIFSVHQSYNNELIGYTENAKYKDKFIECANKHYKNVTSKKLLKRIDKQKELLKLEMEEGDDIDFIIMIKSKIKELESQLIK